MADAPKDFFADGGAPRCTERGEAVLAGLEEVLRAAVFGIQTGVFRDAEPEPDSVLGKDGDVALGAYVHLCLSYVFIPASAHYGAEQASVLVDVLFRRIYDRLPQDELYQHYLELSPFTGRSAGEKRAQFQWSRPNEFVIDLIGRADFTAVLVLEPLLLEMMLDCKSVLEATDPEITGSESAKTLLQRVGQRLEKLDREFPITK